MKNKEMAGDKENKDCIVMRDESQEPTILLADHFEYNGDTTVASSAVISASQGIE